MTAFASLVFFWLWSLPTTLVGLLWSIVCRPVAVRWRDGVLEMQVKWLPMNAAGETIGRLVMYAYPFDSHVYEYVKPHEMRHVAQNERWGVLFGPAYVVACIVAWARGGDFYSDNYFEVQARRESGR